MVIRQQIDGIRIHYKTCMLIIFRVNFLYVILSGGFMSKDLVIKDNTLINATYSLSLTEQRIVLLSISKAQKASGKINAKDYIEIHANDFMTAFGTANNTTYRDLKTACKTLFRREFSYIEGDEIIHSHWLQSSRYNQNTGSIKILFTAELIPFLNLIEENLCYTKYFLKDVSKMTSTYGIRLYELIIAWRSTHKTPIFELQEFRNKLGVLPSEYGKMSNFKKRVLDVAVNQVNEFSNIQIKVEQHKRGRSIYGFSFTFVEIKQREERDPNTVDWVDEQPKQKRKTISEYEASQMANPGEEWPELLKRIGSKYHVIFDKNE